MAAAAAVEAGATLHKAMVHQEELAGSAGEAEGAPPFPALAKLRQATLEAGEVAQAEILDRESLVLKAAELVDLELEAAVTGATPPAEAQVG